MNPINIRDKAVIVRLNCSFSWGTCLDKQITQEATDANHAVQGSIRARKTLLPQDSGVYVSAVQATLSSFYQYHKGKTYATPNEGDRILPTLFYMDYMQKFGETDAAGATAMAALKDNYPASIEKAKKLLGGAFKANDYPDVTEIDRYYRLGVRFLPVPTGDAIMNALGQSVATDVDAYVDEIMKTAAADAKLRLRKAVARMAEALLKKDPRIYATMPEAINLLAEDLPVIAGLTNDPELGTLVQEVKQQLSGYDADDFKKSSGLRSAVGMQAMDILKRMGG